MEHEKIIEGDALESLKSIGAGTVNCCITSPPYFGLRDYGVEGQIGLEQTPEAYVQKLVEIFREVKRVLKKEGTLWLNLGDSYSNEKVGNTETRIHKKAVQNTYKKGTSGLPHKNLLGIPWRVAFALQADGWYLRQDIIWHKPNPMPESVTDRCTKAHEYIFLFSKSPHYYFNNEAIKEPVKEVSLKRIEYGWHGKGDHGQGNYAGLPQTDKMGSRFCNPNGRNKRSVWTVTTKPFSGAHFATFPEALIEPMILAGCPERGLVLDPFFGAGTTGVVAKKLGRDYLGIELNPAYIKIATDRLNGITTNLFSPAKLSTSHGA